MLHFIWKQYEVILQNFYDTEIKESNKQQKLFEIEKTKEQYEHLNKNLHERLKVHYAYENNRLLLDFLLEETEKVKHNLKIDNIYNWMRDYEVEIYYIFFVLRYFCRICKIQKKLIL